MLSKIQIEEMLFGHIFPIMCVFCVGNPEIGYKDYALNVKYDASPIWTSHSLSSNQASVSSPLLESPTTRFLTILENFKYVLM